MNPLLNTLTSTLFGIGLCLSAIDYYSTGSIEIVFIGLTLISFGLTLVNLIKEERKFDDLLDFEKISK